MFLEDLAQKLINGEISLAQWQIEMKAFIRVLHREAALVAVGGADNMTPVLWGYLGYLVKLQYQYLDGFAADILKNPQAWMNGKLLVRMGLYKQAEWGTFEQMVRFMKKMEGWTEERRMLGVADHCTGCLEQAGLGWQPINILAPIGSQQCSTNCHCIFVYRKSNLLGGYVLDE